MSKQWCLSLDVGTEFTLDVALHRVLADVVLSRPKASENSTTGLNGAAKQSGCLPNDLCEVGCLRALSVVLRDFIGPVLDRLCDAVRARASCKVFSKRPEGSTGVFVQTLVCPLLSFSSSVIVPLESNGTVLLTDRVVRAQVRLYIVIGSSASIAGVVAAVSVTAVAGIAAAAAIAIAVTVAVAGALSSGVGWGLGLCRRRSAGLGRRRGGGVAYCRAVRCRGRGRKTRRSDKTKGGEGGYRTRGRDTMRAQTLFNELGRLFGGRGRW